MLGLMALGGSTLTCIKLIAILFQSAVMLWFILLYVHIIAVTIVHMCILYHTLMSFNLDKIAD